MKLTNCLLLTLALANSAAIGAVSYTTYGSVVSENFDTLPATGTGLTWANDSTLSGWSLFTYTNVAIVSIETGTGSSTLGRFYSFGPTGGSDRALGGLASANTYFGSPAPGSGALAGYIALALTNGTGITLDTVSMSFDGEQWRNGGNTTAQKMVLQYGTGATFTGVSTWTTPGGTFDFTSPVATATAAAVDGNGAGKVAGLGGTLTGLTWNAGDTLWIRWVENNDAGNDHGLAIDNFTFAAVPEPTAGLLGLLALSGFALRHRRS